VAYGEEAQAIARELGLRELLAFTLHDLTAAYEMLGEVDKATAAGDEARALWEELGNQPMLANALGNDAKRLLFAGDLRRTGDLAGEVIRIGTAIGNLSTVSLGKILAGLTFLELGEVEAGLDSLQEAVEAGTRGSNAYATTGIRAELAWALASCGRLEEGLALAQESSAEAERSFRSARGWPAAVLIRILLLQGNVPAAEATFSLGGVGATDDRLDDAAHFGGLAIGLASAEMELARDDLDACLATVEKVTAHFRKIGARSHLQDAQLVRSKALLAQRRTAEARAALQEARDIAESIGSRRILWMILDAQADLERSASNKPAADELRRQAREAVESVAQRLGDDSHRASFLASPRVAALLTKSES
jgi:tetratricopeptide (TPR) repeat protein